MSTSLTNGRPSGQPPLTLGPWVIDVDRPPTWAVTTLFFAYGMFLLITIDVLVGGPLRALDDLIAGASWQRSSVTGNRIAYYLDYVGLRGLTAPIVLAVAAWAGRTVRSWRPVGLAVGALLMLNLVTGSIKLLVGRTPPRTGIDELAAGGVHYISGHAANAALSWGLIAYVLYRFAGFTQRRTAMLTGVAVALTVLMTVVSLYRNTHWLTDLLGGVTVGTGLLASFIILDHAVRRRPPATGD